MIVGCGGSIGWPVTCKSVVSLTSPVSAVFKFPSVMVDEKSVSFSSVTGGGW